VTGPSDEDLQEPKIKELVDAYFSTNEASATDRLRLMNLIAEITTNDFAGYQAVLAIHAEGSIEAEKMTIWRNHDVKPSMEYAKRLAGIQG
jgi:aromatic ring hydroxylase